MQPLHVSFSYFGNENLPLAIPRFNFVFCQIYGSLFHCSNQLFCRFWNFYGMEWYLDNWDLLMLDVIPAVLKHYSCSMV